MISLTSGMISFKCFSSVQFSHSVVPDSLRLYGLQHARLPCPSLTHFKLMSIESVMPSNHLILYHPLLLPPSIFPSIRAFSKESVLRIRWPRYWSFSFSISPSNEYSGLISLKMYWLDLLAVQETLKSLPRAFSPHQNRHQLSPSLQAEAKGESSPVPGSYPGTSSLESGTHCWMTPDDAGPALMAQ